MHTDQTTKALNTPLLFDSGDKTVHEVEKNFSDLELFRNYKITKPFRKKKHNPIQTSKDFTIRTQSPNYYHLPNKKMEIDSKMLKMVYDILELLDSDSIITEKHTELISICKKKSLLYSLQQRYQDECDIYVSLMGEKDLQIRTKIGITPRTQNSYPSEYSNLIHGPYSALDCDIKNIYQREFEQNSLATIRIARAPRLSAMILEKEFYKILKQHSFAINLALQNQTKLHFLFHGQKLDAKLMSTFLSNQIYNTLFSLEKNKTPNSMPLNIIKLFQRLYHKINLLPDDMKHTMQTLFGPDPFRTSEVTVYQNPKVIFFRPLDLELLETIKSILGNSYSDKQRFYYKSYFHKGEEVTVTYLGRLKPQSSTEVFMELDENYKENSKVYIMLLDTKRCRGLHVEKQ
jgi:hypothetical protein